MGPEKGQGPRLQGVGGHRVLCLMSFSQTLTEVSLQSEKRKFQMGVCQSGELAAVEIRSVLGRLCLCPGGHPSAPTNGCSCGEGSLPAYSILSLWI